MNSFFLKLSFIVALYMPQAAHASEWVPLSIYHEDQGHYYLESNPGMLKSLELKSNAFSETHQANKDGVVFLYNRTSMQKPLRPIARIDESQLIDGENKVILSPAVGGELANDMSLPYQSYVMKNRFKEGHFIVVNLSGMPISGDIDGEHDIEVGHKEESQYIPISQRKMHFKFVNENGKPAVHAEYRVNKKTRTFLLLPPVSSYSTELRIQLIR